MVHYAGINCTTSNDKGQNNILGQAINHSATIKIKKKKKPEKWWNLSLKERIFHIFLFLSKEKTWQILIFQYFLQFEMEEGIM